MGRTKLEALAILAGVLFGACGGSGATPPRDALALVNAARAAGAEAEARVPGWPALYTSIRSRGDDLEALRRSAPDLEVIDPAGAPQPGEDAFGRPLVVVAGRGALGGPGWNGLLAGGGRSVERDEELGEAGRIVVLRSVTGGPLPRTARPQVYLSQKLDREFEYDPSDGGGRARLVLEPEDDGSVRAGDARRWELEYEAGPLGIRVGGAVFLQSSPWWGWSPAQTLAPREPGYTTATSRAEGLLFEAETLQPGLVRFVVRGRDLAPGERVGITYGDGPAGARADSYAERGERVWVAVDGDGDGNRRVLADSPRLDVRPREPSVLVVTLPSTARPQTPFRLVAAVLDGAFDTGLEVSGRIELLDWPDELGPAPELVLRAGSGGRASAMVAARSPGVVRVRARLELSGSVLEARSNPLEISTGAPLVRWGDLHGHSNFSDGTGLPEDYFTYARDVAALDVAALTDHDDWGFLPLSQHPEVWQEIERQVERFHEPGRFVTLLGYEWTNWIYGHRHVLYFDDSGPLLSSLDERWDTPAELWEALRGRDAVTIPHHPAGEPVPIDWTVAPDPELEPVVELTSVHGTSEAADAPRNVRGAQPGNFVRDALQRGYRLGFVGSGDSHDGHPGLSWFTPQYFNGGLVAFVTEDLTRAGVLAALREHRVYATNGPRILLRCALAGHRMGSAIPAADTGEAAELFVHVLSPEPIARIDAIRSGQVVASLSGDGSDRATATMTLHQLTAGEFVYVRVLAEDEGMAWSSPFYVE